MTGRHPRYSKEEHARRGTELYERSVRPQVEAGNVGKIVAIDVDSGAYEVGEDTLTAANRLLTSHPDAQIWCVRIGSPAVHHFGARAGRDESGRLLGHHAPAEPLRPWEPELTEAEIRHRIQEPGGSTLVEFWAKIRLTPPARPAPRSCRRAGPRPR